MTSVKDKELRTIVRVYFQQQITAFEPGKKHGYQTRFAKKIGVKRPQVTNVENGEGNVSWQMLAKLSEKIGPSMDKILEDLSEMALRFEKRERKARAAMSPEIQEAVSEVEKILEQTGSKRATGRRKQPSEGKRRRPSQDKQQPPDQGLVLHPDPDKGK